MEDLDPDRSRPEHERSQLEDLAAIGIDWDGAVARQSERFELYENAIARLVEADRTYPCWCTRAEIRAATEAPHGELPEGAYPGTCRELSAAERVERERSGRPPALRLDARAEHMRFEDRLHGELGAVVDDLVLRRNDGAPAYNLAVVVDDADQDIAEVVRGDDLLDSTPRQLLLQRLLGLPEPVYAHVPLVLAPDGSRLAKRHGAVTLPERDEPVEETVRWMAAGLGQEPLTAAELVERFDPARIPREPTVFDGANFKRS